GGGPLTTLLMPDPSSVELPDTLWQRLWLNVLPLRDSQFEALDPSSDADMQACFPWMGPTRSSEPKKGQATRPEDAHPLQVYWSMPRRIRLDFDALEDAECDLTGKTGPAVRRYHTRNYGPDYAGNWEHPLSPYYQDKQGQRLPTHPQPGGLGYRDWSSLTIKQGSDGEPLFAKVVHQLYRQRGLTAKTRLWAFGYDMDNMKARCWYDASVPVYPIEDSETRENLAAAVEEIIDATEQVAANLRGQLRKAWTKPGATASGDISFIADAFWQRSASDFYALLDDFVSLYMAEPQAADSEQEAALRRAWHKRIHWLSLNLFDAWAMAGDFAFADPIRISKARKALGRFNYKTAIKTALRYRKPESTPQEDAA
ncbi:MAG: type I-E CRISPR-associated protein Cse1/CasA, partial [Gammaproteobacteria bacterium]